MRRFVLWTAIAFLTTSPAAADAISERLDALEKRVQALEAIVLHPAKPAAVIGTPGRVEEATQSLLKLTGWSAAFKPCAFREHCYAISYTLLNEYNKPIKLLDASLKFYDLVGEKIYGIELAKDVKLAPGKEATFHGDYGVNEFLSEEMRLKDLAPTDVRAELDVGKLVFSDNTVLDLK